MNRSLALLFLLILALCAHVRAQDKPAVVPAPAESKAISYGLVVDNSGSFRTLFDRVISIAAEVIDENKGEDETFLVTFVDTPKIVLRQEFTYRKSELHDAVENMYIEGGQTAILDAIKSSADYLAKDALTDGDRSRALVLITDGEDRGSSSKVEDVLKLLKEQKIRVFVIAISDIKVVTKLLDRLTKETGGLLVMPKNRTDTAAAVKQIATAMRTK